VFGKGGRGVFWGIVSFLGDGHGLFWPFWDATLGGRWVGLDPSVLLVEPKGEQFPL
jgi:hypothetical protein